MPNKGHAFEPNLSKTIVATWLLFGGFTPFGGTFGAFLAETTVRYWYGSQACYQNRAHTLGGP